MKVEYEPPAVREIGRVHELTMLQDKDYGATDGFSFQGQSIGNSSQV